MSIDKVYAPWYMITSINTSTGWYTIISTYVVREWILSLEETEWILADDPLFLTTHVSSEVMTLLRLKYYDFSKYFK